MHLRIITHFFLSVSLGMLLLLCFADRTCAQSASPSEYQLKAAFIYNFGKFIEWPPSAFASPDSPFIIGILGENPFGDTLEKAVANKTINAHPIQIQVLDDLSKISSCHLLFISNAKKLSLREVFQKLKGAPVLTVGESDEFISQGGMLNFVEEAKKIRFQINEAAARDGKLRMSSKLLSLAIPVRP